VNSRSPGCSLENQRVATLLLSFGRAKSVGNRELEYPAIGRKQPKDCHVSDMGVELSHAVPYLHYGMEDTQVRSWLSHACQLLMKGVH
jgi:hypothetical protein